MKKIALIIVAALAAVAFAKVPVTVIPGAVDVRTPSVTYKMRPDECPLSYKTTSTLRELADKFIERMGKNVADKEFACLYSENEPGLYMSSLTTRFRLSDYQLIGEDSYNYDVSTTFEGNVTQMWLKREPRGMRSIIINYYPFKDGTGIALYVSSILFEE